MSSATSSSFWCYRCNRFVRVWTNGHDSSVVCPDCYGGFVEQISHSPPSPSSRRFPMYMVGNPSPSPSPNPNSNPNPNHISSSPRIRRSRRTAADRSPFNPVIVLRAPSEETGTTSGYELFYDDGGGSGLRPLPTTVSEFLLGSGFDRLLDQLTQIEINGLGRVEQPPASKAAIESMPTVEIGDAHVVNESHCAVCKEAFQIGSEAREMPCKHIYHSDCILPWLSLRNSCPVCRHELPGDSSGQQNLVENSNEDDAVGLTIWRLPGGGFAVGRFSGRRGSERELPVVYTEMDGGFNHGGLPRRISWGSRSGRSRESGGIRRALRHLFSCFGGVRSSESSSSSSESHGSRRLSVFSSASRRGLDIGSRVQRW